MTATRAVWGFWWIAFGVLMAGLRIGGITSQSFQAVAHSYVTIMFVEAYHSWRVDWPRFGFYLTCGVVISLVELGAFLGVI